MSSEAKRTRRASRLALGRIVATPGAVREMDRLLVHPAELLKRHSSGDWGELDDQDRRQNELALIHGLRLLSSYVMRRDGVETTLWVITEADRSVTTILLPQEY